MTITETNPRPRLRRPRGTSRSGAERRQPLRAKPDAAPIVVAVNNSPAAAAAARTAVRLAQELAAPLMFVYVRRGPSLAFGKPYYQRRLDAEMRTGRRVLDDALAAAERAGVPATGEQLEGNPARRVVELARHRGARLIALGSRRLRLGKSVSRKVIRSADRPVLVVDPTEPAAA